VAQKKISVIIPNYNYARYIEQAIESVLIQSYENVELIIVNNGSTDNSLEVLEKFGDKIHLIDQPNLGQSGARNSGLSLSSGELIAFLDADDFWEPNKLEMQISLMNDATQLVYSGISPFKDPGGEKLQSVLPKYKGSCSKYFIDLPGASIVLSGEAQHYSPENYWKRSEFLMRNLIARLDGISLGGVPGLQILILSMNLWSTTAYTHLT